jgi:hypothetical protein
MKLERSHKRDYGCPAHGRDYSPGMQQIRDGPILADRDPWLDWQDRNGARRSAHVHILKCV